MQINTPYADKLNEMGTCSYCAKILNIKADMHIIIGEAGPYWDQCEYTQRLLAAHRRDIDEIEADARERYMDWATG